MSRTRMALAGGVLLVVAAAAGAANVLLRNAAGPQAVVPSAVVTRGTLSLDVSITGELRATRAVALTAPPASNPLRLVRLAETGAGVHAGDVVMEFDPVDELHELDESRSELAEAEQQITKMRADNAVEDAQAAVDRLTAEFDVRRAEMDAAAGTDLIGDVEAKKRSLALVEARRKFEELTASAASRTATSQAALASLEEKRNKARLTAERAGQTIAQLAVQAPIDGVVVRRQNPETTQIFFSGMTLPDYRVGDTVGRGRLVVDVVDPSQVEIRGSVSERDRPNVGEHQPAAVAADALGGLTLPAHVTSVAGLSSRNIFGPNGAVRQFDVVLQLDEPDSRLRPGTTVHIVIAGRTLVDVLNVARQAVFTRDGTSLVYMRDGNRFREQPVTVIGGNESRMAIEGIEEGTEVALVDPAAATRLRAGSAGETRR